MKYKINIGKHKIKVYNKKIKNNKGKTVCVITEYEMFYDGSWCKCQCGLDQNEFIIYSVVLNKETVNLNEKIKLNKMKVILLKCIIVKKFNKLKNFLKTRINTLIVFGVAILFSFLYYYLYNFVDVPMSQNKIIKTFLFFLTTSSVINIFYPFTLKKPLDKNDIKETTRETNKEDKKTEEDNKRREKYTTF